MKVLKPRVVCFLMVVSVLMTPKDQHVCLLNLALHRWYLFAQMLSRRLMELSLVIKCNANRLAF